MKPSRWSIAVPAIALLVVAAPLAAAPVATAAPFVGDEDGQTRSADVILEEYEAVEMPSYDRSRADEEGYVEAFMAERTAAQERQAALILELYRVDPGHEQVPELMPRRWSTLMSDPPTLYAELDLMLETHAGEPLAVDALYFKGLTAGRTRDAALLGAATDAFLEAAPGDERGARLLDMLAGVHDFGSAEQRAAYERALELFAGTRSTAYTPGKLRQIDGVGQPFELAFEDAISGQPVAMRDLLGKVVVVDFWATWCGPCIAEMPHMKELYAEYADQGVEFVGVSLDRDEASGGLEALRNYVAENEIGWPQYYQGNFWSGEFSTSWGINSIPAVFIVDKQGVLRDVKARGKLDELIPELLAES